MQATAQHESAALTRALKGDASVRDVATRSGLSCTTVQKYGRARMVGCLNARQSDKDKADARQLPVLPYTGRMGAKGKKMTFSVFAGLAVAAFSLFAALWVNGNIPPVAAISTSLFLGVAVFVATARGQKAKEQTSPN